MKQHFQSPRSQCQVLYSQRIKSKKVSTLPKKSSFSLKTKIKINTCTWLVNKYSVHSTEMHMKTGITEMNPTPKKNFNRACNRIPKAGDSHVLITICIFETILSGITVGKHARKKTHLHTLESYLTYSSWYIGARGC